MNKYELNDQLIHACKTGNLDLVKESVYLGADVNCYRVEYNYFRNIHIYPILEACRHGYLSIVKFLYEHGTDITISENGPFNNACYYGHLSVAKYLYNNITIERKDIVMEGIVAFGDLDIIKWLHSLNYNCINYIDTACLYGHLEVVKFFVSIGGNPNIPSYARLFRVGFRNACANGYLDIVKYLVSLGCDPNGVENWPLLLASNSGHLEVVKYLVNLGCNPMSHNNSAIRWASERNHLSMVKYLYSIGCDPTANNNQAIADASKCVSYEIYKPIITDKTIEKKKKEDIKTINLIKFLASVGCDTSKIHDPEIRKIAEDYIKYKPIMDRCLNEIYGNPALERTRTENEIYFKEHLK